MSTTYEHHVPFNCSEIYSVPANCPSIQCATAKVASPSCVIAYYSISQLLRVPFAQGMLPAVRNL